MTDMPVYEFDGYTFRPAEWNDLPLAQAWNRSDPDHGWELQYPRYWIEQSQDINSYVLQDFLGIVFFVKSIRLPEGEIEITMQFDRQHDEVSGKRLMAGLAAGFKWLKVALPMNGVKVLSFVSKNQKLIVYVEKRYKFRKDGMRFVFEFNPEQMAHGKVDGKETQQIA